MFERDNSCFCSNLVQLYMSKNNILIVQRVQHLNHALGIFNPGVYEFSSVSTVIGTEQLCDRNTQLTESFMRVNITSV